MKRLGIRISLVFILVAALTIGSVGTAMADKPVKTVEIVQTGWESGNITFNYTWSGWGTWGVLVRAYQYTAGGTFIKVYESQTYPTANGKRVTNFAGTESIGYDDSGTYQWKLYMYLIKKNGNFIRQGGVTAYAWTDKFTIVH